MPPGSGCPAITEPVLSEHPEVVRNAVAVEHVQGVDLIGLDHDQVRVDREEGVSIARLGNNVPRLFEGHGPAVIGDRGDDTALPLGDTVKNEKTKT